LDDNGDIRNSYHYFAFGDKAVEAVNMSGTNYQYTSQENDLETGLYNYKARLYDPLLGRFYAMDPAGQFASPYLYAGNNPVSFNDPSGELIFTASTILSGQWYLLPTAIGADLGMWQGGVMANGGELNPTKWDYSSGKTLGYMLGGAVVGGFSGWLGGSIATSEIPFANTLGIASSSYVNSIGTNMYTRGQTDISLSLGVASYNFSTGDFGYLGKNGNKWYENLAYSMGGLANLTDVVSALGGGGGTNLDINSADPTKPHEWWGHSSATNQSGDIDISVGPAGKRFSKLDYWDPSGGGKLWNDYAGAPGTWTVKVNNVNYNILRHMTNNIFQGKGLYGIGQLRWNLYGFACENHVSRALWAVGVPTLPINIHPIILNTQLFIRNMGIYSSPYLYK